MNSGVDRTDALPGAAGIMTSGGDQRIRLDPKTGLNRYFSAPLPSSILAYASSTANDISPEAFAHVEALLAAIGPELDGRGYAARLEALRRRLRSAYGVDESAALI